MTGKLLLLLLFIIGSAQSEQSSTDCDRLSAQSCHCNTMIQDVICSISDDNIPQDLPENITFLTLNSIDDKFTTLKSGAFPLLPNLQTLTIMGTSLREIENSAFSNVKNLRSLNINNNKIETIGFYSFQGLSKLEYLYLQYNKLQMFQISADIKLPKLRTIDLSDNLLQYVPQDIIRRVETGNITLDVFQNQWHCNCMIGPLRDWFVKLGMPTGQQYCTDTTENCFICSSPQQIKGRIIASLLDVEIGNCDMEAGERTEFGDDSEMGVITILCLVFLLLVVITVYLWATRKVLCVKKKKKTPEEESATVVRRKLLSTIPETSEIEEEDTEMQKGPIFDKYEPEMGRTKTTAEIKSYKPRQDTDNYGFGADRSHRPPAYSRSSQPKSNDHHQSVPSERIDFMISPRKERGRYDIDVAPAPSLHHHEPKTKYPIASYPPGAHRKPTQSYPIVQVHHDPYHDPTPVARNPLITARSQEDIALSNLALNVDSDDESYHHPSVPHRHSQDAEENYPGYYRSPPRGYRNSHQGTEGYANPALKLSNDDLQPFDNQSQEDLEKYGTAV